MTGQQLINAKEFCLHHNIEVTFIDSLNEYGLIRTTVIEQDTYVDADDLSQLEKLMRMHYDLHINLEGIDVIAGLLEKLENMEDELSRLRNRLGVYGSNNDNVTVYITD